MATEHNNDGIHPQSVKCDSGFRGMEKKYYTKCFYHSDLDKEIVRGLIAKDNKARALTLPNKQTIVKSKSFVGQGMAIVGQKPCKCVKMLNNDFSHIVSQSLKKRTMNVQMSVTKQVVTLMKWLASMLSNPSLIAIKVVVSRL